MQCFLEGTEYLIAMFEISNVYFSYPDEKPIINDVSLKIKRGESLAIIGQNGCGKTTLLSILNGLIFPDKGEVLFQNEVLNEKILKKSTFSKNFRQKVGLVFQNPDVQFFCSTVREELAFGPRQLKLDCSKLDETVSQIAKLFRLESYLERPPFSLSYGEKKRVALASIFAVSPEILLMDEPTTGLDPKNKKILVSLINDIKATGTTVIITTHDYEFASAVADRIAVMSKDGKIIHSDSTENVLNNVDILEEADLV